MYVCCRHPKFAYLFSNSGWRAKISFHLEAKMLKQRLQGSKLVFGVPTMTSEQQTI